MSAAVIWWFFNRWHRDRFVDWKPDPRAEFYAFGHCDNCGWLVVMISEKYADRERELYELEDGDELRRLCPGCMEYTHWTRDGDL